MRPPPGRSLAVAAFALFVGGCVGGGCVGAIRAPFDRGNAVYARLPHHVPPTPDATPFRFAMVHDVIHERYARNGPAFFRERERLARERMAVLPPDSEAVFALTDDIAVGMDRTERTNEAIALMRDKLKRQEAIGLTGKDVYSSYANLGEFLVRGDLWAMLGGDAAARERVQEGKALLRKSVEVNPKAHFGREEWHLVAIDTLLVAGDQPAVLRECDPIGNRLDLPIQIPTDSWYTAPYEDYEAVFGRPYHRSFSQDLHFELATNYADAVDDPERRSAVRRYIYQVGGEQPKSGVKYGRRAPFDEPALWLIGEWRQGSGPSPHLALCLGEIMLRVGQRYLAWNCYERAARMADQFSPKAELQQFLRDHCQARQAVIEKSLKPDDAAGLRTKFEAELAFGEAYQRDYQAYTEQKIDAGANLNDPHFFDEFHAGRPSIASKVGPEEWYAGEVRGYGIAGKSRAFWAWGLLTGGACVLVLALIQRWRYRPSPLRLTEITPPP